MLPATVAQEPGLELAPSVVVRLDIEVNQALGLARLWRRLGELRSWRPLADPATLREALKSLGSVPEDADIVDWLAAVRMAVGGPELIRAGRAALDWTLYPGMEQSPASFFLAACLWREKGVRAPIALPFWAAPERHHHRLALQVGLKWMAEFLECVTAAAIVGLRELERLREIEQKGGLLGPTARSRLPDALDAVASRADCHIRVSGQKPGCHSAGGTGSAAATDGGRYRAGSDGACVLAGFRASMTKVLYFIDDR